MGCTSVREDELAVIETFGRFDHIADPGFTCLPIPGIWNVAGRMSRRVKQIPVQVSTKTKDNVFVNVTIGVQFRVLDDKDSQYDAFYKLSNPAHQVQSYVEDVVRTAVPTLELDSFYTQQHLITEQVKEQLAESMKTLGYEIIDALLINIDPDRVVKTSMNDINVSRRERIANQERAEAEKFIRVKAAEAQAQATYLSGDGVARQRQALVKGFETSVQGFSDKNSIPPKEVADLLLITQYFDTVKSLGDGQESEIVFLNRRPRRPDEPTATLPGAPRRPARPAGD
eukprot:Selendium_serpulae@DN3260_c0_g1_i1.p2